MEMASAWGFVRTLLIIILFYYAFKFLMRIFAPILMQKAVNKMQEKMQEQYRQQQEQYNDTSQSTKATPQSKKEVGEYIDYEEVK
jgi:predicted Holliday junction resolvase-like endonuclease